MSRTVFCRKYQQELPGLERPPYPGPKGEKIFNEVSKRPGKNGRRTRPC